MSGEPEHAVLSWPLGWRAWWFRALAAIVLVSIAIPIAATAPTGQPITRPDGRPLYVNRWMPWTNSFHPFTWGAGLQAMQ